MLFLCGLYSANIFIIVSNLLIIQSRENARCQTFPDDWEFCGNISSQYKQVGNAVPVNLAYEIAKEISKSLDMVCEIEKMREAI